MVHDLGVLTDTLNDVLERAEKALKGLRYGVAAFIPLDDEGRELGFKKLTSNNQWHFVVVSPNGEMGKLHTMPRRLRIMAAKKIPELYEALLDEVNVEAINLQATIERLEEFVEKIEKVTQ